MDPEGCQVNAAIERALREGAPAYEKRGILVSRHLDATHRLATVDPALDQALYTLFRGLPARLAPGATLLVSTADRAGGDVELGWEAREVDVGAPADGTPLVAGPYGDLLELALAGLDAICRVRSAYREEPMTDTLGSSAFLKLAPNVRRRYVFLVPSLVREGNGVPASRRGA